MQWFTACEERGYRIASDEEGCPIIVDGERFLCSLYGTLDKFRHEPIAEDLLIEDFRLWPGGNNPHRKWDFSPSSRLVLKIDPITFYRGDTRPGATYLLDRKFNPPDPARFFDRKYKPIENCLNDAMVFLVGTAAWLRNIRFEVEEARQREVHRGNKRDLNKSDASAQSACAGSF